MPFKQTKKLNLKRSIFFFWEKKNYFEFFDDCEMYLIKNNKELRLRWRKNQISIIILFEN